LGLPAPPPAAPAARTPCCPQVKINLPALLAYLNRLLEEKGHAVVCVAEGAGQELLYECEPGRARGWGRVGGLRPIEQAHVQERGARSEQGRCSVVGAWVQGAGRPMV
jgi:hypothetical protein